MRRWYGLPKPADASSTLGDWMLADLNGPLVASDAVQFGPATLVVRELGACSISRFGLGLKD